MGSAVGCGERDIITNQFGVKMFVDLFCKEMAEVTACDPIRVPILAP